jgi:hypothetical protein
MLKAIKSMRAQSMELKVLRLHTQMLKEQTQKPKNHQKRSKTRNLMLPQMSSKRNLLKRRRSEPNQLVTVTRLPKHNSRLSCTSI